MAGVGSCNAGSFHTACRDTVRRVPTVFVGLKGENGQSGLHAEFPLEGTRRIVSLNPPVQIGAYLIRTGRRWHVFPFRSQGGLNVKGALYRFAAGNIVVCNGGSAENSSASKWHTLPINLEYAGHCKAAT
jgi:hypothetical protein